MSLIAELKQRQSKMNLVGEASGGGAPKIVPPPPVRVERDTETKRVENTDIGIVSKMVHEMEDITKPNNTLEQLYPYRRKDTRWSIDDMRHSVKPETPPVDVSNSQNSRTGCCSVFCCFCGNTIQYGNPSCCFLYVFSCGNQSTR